MLMYKRDNPSYSQHIKSGEDVYDMLKYQGLKGWSKLSKTEKLSWFVRTTSLQQSAAESIVDSCQTDDSGDIIVNLDELLDADMITDA